MASFVDSDFYSRYLPSYFTEIFESICKQQHSGCIDDIDADWNIFILVDNFISFISSLHIDPLTLNAVLQSNFIIRVENMHPDRIQTSLKNEDITAIIVKGISSSSVPLVQLIFRLFLTQISGAADVNYEDLNKLISDARIKAGQLDPSYFHRLFDYILEICLKRCKTKSFLKVYKTILRQNDLFDDFEHQIQEVNARINQCKMKSAKKQSKQEKSKEDSDTIKNFVNSNSRTPTKSKIAAEKQRNLKSSKPIQFNTKRYLSQSQFVHQSAQKLPITIKPSKPSHIPRTIFAINNKKFIPKRLFDTVDSTMPSPSSRKNKILQIPCKRSHSSIYYSNDYEAEDSININCLVQQTPVRHNRPIMTTTKKMSSMVPLSFDTSPKKKYKRS